MKKLLASLLALSALFSAAAFAGNGTWTNVSVTSIKSWSSEGFGPNGVEIVQLSGSSSGGPSCASGTTAYVIVDPSTAGGAIVMSVLSQAKLLGTLVTIFGAGSCGVVSGYETLAWVQQ